MTGCYKLQKDYDYNPQEADPKVNMTAKDYIISRGTAAPNNDTIFKWMQLAIEYSGIDITEYEKPGRTFILLHTDAVRRLTTGKVTAGFFFDYPVIVKDIAGCSYQIGLKSGIGFYPPGCCVAGLFQRNSKKPVVVSHHPG